MIASNMPDSLNVTKNIISTPTTHVNSYDFYVMFGQLHTSQHTLRHIHIVDGSQYVLTHIHLTHYILHTYTHHTVHAKYTTVSQTQTHHTVSHTHTHHIVSHTHTQSHTHHTVLHTHTHCHPPMAAMRVRAYRPASAMVQLALW